MELPEIIALDPEDLTDELKDEVFHMLAGIENVEDVPRKNLRRTLAICLMIMKHKGEQVDTIQTQLDLRTQGDSGDDSRSERIQEENEKLKRMVNKLEEDKAALKSKTKEMSEDILHLQKRLAEAMQSAESDKDSSDPLSELDRQEELLKNINVKNKHIKRLLREIEALQSHNIEQSKTIIDLEKQHQHAKVQINDFNSKITVLEEEKKGLHETVNQLQSELTRLEGNITYLEDERERSEADLKRLIEKLESKAKSWRSTIDQKDREIKKLKSKMESFRDVRAQDDEDPDEQESEGDKERLVEESTRMMHAIEVRDKIIEKMESKIKSMAEEMISSTRLMNKLSAEREDERILDSKRSRPCCKIIEESLKASNEHCRELSDLLEKSEEDNLIKSQQAAQALAALDAYQRGEDGLPKALKKISSLEQKLSAREKQIRSQVTELNAMHEISSENSLLRKKLNIPEDVVLTAKNVAAKERSKDKQIERLTMKLRASEEMRLQLKLEKSDLRKQLMSSTENTTKNIDPHQSETLTKSVENSPEKRRPDIYCDHCLKNIQILPNKDTVMQDVVKEWESKYSDVVEENENLRVGMHEILEKIREYDATSEHITIDCEILERLLHALDARSISGWYHPAMRIQNELIALKKRELALREKINTIARKENDTSAHESIEEVREAGEIPDSPAPSLPLNQFDSSTRPTTPNKGLDQSLYPVIVEADIEHESMKTEFLRTLEKNRFLQQEIQRLQVFQVNFEELSVQMAASESDVTKYCSILVEKLSTLEIQLNTKVKAYEFLREDYDRTLNESKASEMRNVALIADLKKQVNDRKHDISLLRGEKDSLLKERAACNPEEYNEMQKTLYNLQQQVAALVDGVLSGNISELKIEGICMDYGVIQENLEMDFITVDQYEDMQRENAESAARQNELQTKCDRLESLLLIANEQVTSQQKLLTEINDNHINLRHLVADLQSSNEDKYLIAKTQSELEAAKRESSSLKLEKDKLEQDVEALKKSIKAKGKELERTGLMFQNEMRNAEIKSKFLKKSLQNLRQKYFKYTPLIFLSNFVYAYTKFIKRSKDEEKRLQESLSKQMDSILSSKIEAAIGNDNISEDTIKLIKTETRAKYLENQVQALNEKNTALQTEMEDLRLIAANESEHWKTIEALFGSDQSGQLIDQETQTDENETLDSIIQRERVEIEPEKEALPKVDKSLSPIPSPTKKDVEKCVQNSETQTTSVGCVSKQTSPMDSPVKRTEVALDSQGVQTSPLKQQAIDPKLTTSTSVQTSPKGSPKRLLPPEDDTKVLELENQLKEMQTIAEERKDRFEKAEKGLEESRKSLVDMEKRLKDQQEDMEKQKRNQSEEQTSYQAGIVEKTILSFHSLLSEKDKSIHQYQELLTAERNQNESVCLKYEKQIQSLAETISDLNAGIKAKDEEILELKTKIQATRGVEKEKVELASGIDDNGDNSMQELSDEKIEEMFNDDAVSEVSEKKPNEVNKNIFERELKNKEKFWENKLRVKEEEIGLLKEKLQLYQEREKSDSGMNPEMEQLRVLLEEKDKHINDLMDTLTNFHDDQQRFLNDSTTYSADQISRLAANLTRSEATNKIYQAQLEALRRQLANLNQREKQARDLNTTLRNQLIKRPVVSIKTELNARLKTENLQKKISQLEGELEDAQIHIKRQQVIIDAKRAKSNNEVGLWEKQKRWQQSAEKFKAKLEETEASLEKHKALLHSARTTIARLEKDKHILEGKVGKGSNPLKCCRTPSCPNLQGTKYTPSETPETYTGESECSSPTRGLHFIGSNHNELIEALKARIELQQRKIIAMEMEGKGNNALTTELERLQEKFSATEAQNIRLEARNLQLQLDNDLLRQGDVGERMQKRVKHLEDYIIALKEELAQVEARKQLSFDPPKQERKYAPGQAEQTILSLRGIVEKLRVENKYLKDGRRSCDPKDQENPSELTRLQHMYTESLDKISALQIELQLKCQNCGNRSHLEKFSNDELRLIKDQLLKKTQLLEKAKILLTRAAAKEKVLKEQLMLWKRKCSELQNVPVIEEISE